VKMLLRRVGLGDLAAQSLASYSATALSFLRAIVLAGILSLHDFAVLAVASLITSLAQYADLGAALGMEQRVAEVSSADDVVRVGQDGLRFRTATALAVSACLLLAATTINASAVTEAFVGAAVVIPVQAVLSGQQGFLRGRRRFGGVASTAVMLGASSLVMGVAGALVWGLPGVFTGQVVAGVLAILLARGFEAPLPRLGTTLKPSAELLRIGWPLAILSGAMFALVYVDQAVAGAWVGVDAVGTYSMVTNLGAAIYLLPTALAAVLAPRLLATYARHKRIDSIAGYCWRPTEALRISMPALVAVVWLLAPIFLRAVLPKYLAATAPLRIYAAALYFLSVNLGPNATLVALRRHGKNVPIVVGVLVVNVIADYVLVLKLGLGLEGISWGSVIAYATYLACHLTLIGGAFTASRIRVGRIVWRNLWPGLAIVLALRVMSPDLGVVSSWRVLAASVVPIGLSLVLMAGNPKAEPPALAWSRT